MLSPEIDEDRLPNALLKVGDDLRCPRHPEVSPHRITPPLLALQSGLAMSPRQRKKVYCTTPTVKGT